MNGRIVTHPDFEVDLDNEPWQFYLLGVWSRPEGYYMSTDVGCSCPMPWDSHTEGDLTGPLTFEQVAEEARSLAATSAHPNVAIPSVEELLDQMRGEVGT